MASVVQSPRRVQHVNDVVTQLERGDLRLRVRVLESEAAFARLEATQGSLTAAVMATLLLNSGIALASSTSAPAVVGSRAMYALAGFFGFQIPVGYFKVMCVFLSSLCSFGFEERLALPAKSLGRQTLQKSLFARTRVGLGYEQTASRAIDGKIPNFRQGSGHVWASPNAASISKFLAFELPNEANPSRFGRGSNSAKA